MSVEETLGRKNSEDLDTRSLKVCKRSQKIAVGAISNNNITMHTERDGGRDPQVDTDSDKERLTNTARKRERVDGQRDENRGQIHMSSKMRCTFPCVMPL